MSLKTNAGRTELGGYEAVARISVTQVGDTVQVAFTEHRWTADTFRMSASNATVYSKQLQALEGAEAFGSESGTSAAKLKSYHYVMSMPYFDNQDSLAVDAGVEVYATASERHHASIRAAGAVPLPRDDWSLAVAEIGGVDVVLDGVGVRRFWTSYRSLRRGGRLVAIGVSDAAARGSMMSAAVGFMSAMLLYPLIPDGRRSRTYSITSVRKARPDWFAQDLAALLDKLERGVVHPVVAERLTLNNIADAHARLEAGGLTGKLVVEP